MNRRISKRIILTLLFLVFVGDSLCGQSSLNKSDKLDMTTMPAASINDDLEWLSFFSHPPSNPLSEPRVQAQTTLNEKGDEGEVLFNFTIPGARRIETENGAVLRIPTASLSLEEGRPLVPGLVSDFVLPGNSVVTGIELVFDDSIRIPEANPMLYQVTAITPDGPKTRAISTPPLSHGIYPLDFYRLNHFEPLRDGNTMGSITIWPVQYDVDTKEWVVHTNIELAVSFSVESHSNQTRESYVQRALNAHGHLGPMTRGIKKEWVEEDRVSKETGYLVKRDGSTELTVIAGSFTRPDGSFHSTHHYSVISYGNRPGLLKREDRGKEGASILSREECLERLQRKCNGIVEITNRDQGLDFVQEHWTSSPGIILFDSSSPLGINLCPLASLLDWPLVGVPDGDITSRILELMKSLGCDTIVTAGPSSDSLDQLIDSTNCSIINLVDDDDINLFITAQKHLLDFNLPMPTPLDIAYREAKNLDMVETLLARNRATGNATRGGFWIMYYEEFENSAAYLASYYICTLKDVENYSAGSIRGVLSYNNAAWAAMMGDGDTGEVSCFFIDDPVDDGSLDEMREPGSGNGIIATDFYYEDFESSVGDLPSSWTPDCWVSRPIGFNDSSVMDYINIYMTYVMRALTDPEWSDKYAVCGIHPEFWDPGGCTLLDIDGYLDSRGVITSAELHDGSYYGEFTIDNYTGGIWGLDSGVCVGYVFTHGDYNSISFSTDKLKQDDVNSHEPIWTQRPFYQHSAACCLTALFAGSEKIENSGWYPDNDENIACKFIDSGALAYLGSTMIAYDIQMDEVDNQMFEHRLTDWNYAVAGALAWGRKSFYAAQSSPDGYDRKTVWELMLLGVPTLNLCMERTDPYVRVPHPDLNDDGEAFRSFSPQTVYQGPVESFEIHCDVRNIGDADAGYFNVSFYASENTTITSSDYFIGQATIYDLDAGNRVDCDWYGTFPSNVPAGTYYIGWIIDDDNRIWESNENNNTAYKEGYQLTVEPPHPDLYDYGESWRYFWPLTVHEGLGESFEVACCIENGGYDDSGPFEVHFYASTNTVITPFDHFLGSDNVANIPYQGLLVCGWTGSFPTSIPAGDYWIGWIIDANDEVDEMDETNNIAYKESEQLHVIPWTPPSPDIKVNGLDGPLYLTTSDTITVTVHLDPGSLDGEPADWWIYTQKYPSKTWWAKFRTGQKPQWTQSATPIRFAGATLRTVNSYTVLGPRTMPAAQWSFWFAVDDNKDGICDGTFSDIVEVSVN